MQMMKMNFTVSALLFSALAAVGQTPRSNRSGDVSPRSQSVLVEPFKQFKLTVLDFLVARSPRAGSNVRDRILDGQFDYRFGWAAFLAPVTVKIVVLWSEEGGCTAWKGHWACASRIHGCQTNLVTVH